MMNLPASISSRDFTFMCELYREWNGKINVISRKDIDHVLEHHVMHSLGIALYLWKVRPDEFARWEKGGIRVLDVGCGGGFPGIPLASVFPGVHFTLCDSIGKKVKVASEVASSLGLANVECVHSRVEDLDGSWDHVVSRAVTSLDRFLPWVRGRYEGSVLYLKGGDISGELSACRRLFPGVFPKVETWALSDGMEDPYFLEKMVVDIPRF